jgi:hypothetical protein
MLEARVRCLLGTEADGVEHSEAYAYAASLIAYWKQTDPAFHTGASGIGQQTLFDNVRWHLSNMASDRALTY